MNGKLVKWDASACTVEKLAWWKLAANWLSRREVYQARTLTPDGDPIGHPGCIEVIEFTAGEHPRTIFRRP